MRSGKYIKQLNGYRAFIPEPLPPQPPLTLDEEIAKDLSQATLLLARLDGLAYGLPNIDMLITMYVKKEALLSAQIEGTQATLENVLEYESGLVPPNMEDVSEVINYIKALNYGIKRLNEFPMSMRLIKAIHALLLDHTRGSEKTPGEYKKSQNWIGAPGSTLNTAAFVPPPPEEAAHAMSDLEKYMHEQSPYPDLIDCALIHYQFETIHPFLDGNGRAGRLLITLYLYWKGTIERPLLYMSYFLKKNKQEYFDRLTMTRTNGNYEQWVKFFLKGVIQTCESGIDTTKRILDLERTYHEKLLTANTTTQSLTLFRHLFYKPIITTLDAKELLKISYPTASLIIKEFVSLGILKELGERKKNRFFIFAQYVEILSEGTALG